APNFADELVWAIEPQALSVGNKQVGVISLTGVLTKGGGFGTSTMRARRDLRVASNDPGIVGIVIAADSPGGTVSGTADLAAEIRTARNAKPVYGHALRDAERVLAEKQETRTAMILPREHYPPGYRIA